MAYTNVNFKTKKALKDAVKEGREITILPGFLEHDSIENGTTCVEGPHAPEPHKWYATVTVKNGIITKVT